MNDGSGVACEGGDGGWRLPPESIDVIATEEDDRGGGPGLGRPPPGGGRDHGPKGDRGVGRGPGGGGKGGKVGGKATAGSNRGNGDGPTCSAKDVRVNGVPWYLQPLGLGGGPTISAVYKSTAELEVDRLRGIQTMTDLENARASGMTLNQYRWHRANEEVMRPWYILIGFGGAFAAPYSSDLAAIARAPGAAIDNSIQSAMRNSQAQSALENRHVSGECEPLL